MEGSGRAMAADGRNLLPCVECMSVWKAERGRLGERSRTGEARCDIRVSKRRQCEYERCCSVVTHELAVAEGDEHCTTKRLLVEWGAGHKQELERSLRHCRIYNRLRAASLLNREHCPE